jgi:hypothetical protein
MHTSIIMPQLVLPRTTTTAAPARQKSPPVDLEALIREARRRQRRRRLALAAAALLVAMAGAAAWRLAVASPPPAGRTAGRQRAPAGLPGTLTLQLVGWGTVIQPYLGRGACPDGRTSMSVRSSTGAKVGSVVECDLVVTKVDEPNWGVRRTHAELTATYTIPGGTIVTREQRTFLFARDQIHSTGRFTGRIIGGTGRYAHARGTVSGGGPGTGRRALWKLELRFR